MQYAYDFSEPQIATKLDRLDQLHLPCFMGWPETGGGALVSTFTGTDAKESPSRREAVQRYDDPRDHGWVDI